MTKIDHLFRNPSAEKGKSGSVVYSHRLSTMQNQENTRSDEHQDAQSIDSLATPALFDAIQNLQRIHRKPKETGAVARRRTQKLSLSEVAGAVPPLIENNFPSRQAARRQK